MGSSALQANSLLTELSVKPKLMQAPQLKTFFVLLGQKLFVFAPPTDDQSITTSRFNKSHEPGCIKCVSPSHLRSLKTPTKTSTASRNLFV